MSKAESPPATPAPSATNEVVEFRRLPPEWIPPGVDYEAAPERVKIAVRRIVSPAYEELVEGAVDAMERSLGFTMTHLLWLEVLEHLRLEEHEGDAGGNAELDDEAWIARQVKLFDAKLRASKTWIQYRQFQQRFGRRPRMAGTHQASTCVPFDGWDPPPRRQEE